MGLLSRMEQNGHQDNAAPLQAETKTETKPKATADSLDEKYSDVKKRIHSAVIENFNKPGLFENINGEQMKTFLLEEVGKDGYNVCQKVL